MIMRATERDAELLKLRAVTLAARARPRVGRRGAKEGIVVLLGVCGVVMALDGRAFRGRVRWLTSTRVAFGHVIGRFWRLDGSDFGASKVY